MYDDFHPDYHDYSHTPPEGRPDNGPARPHDTYGNERPPRRRPEPPHDCYGAEPTLGPGYHLLPVPPNTWGMSTEQQIMALGQKVDELIHVFNDYDRKVYGAWDAVVNSALCNDAYYGEITVEDGYMGDTGAKYKVIHIPFLDRSKQPIYLELGIPFNNTTNEGLSENAFDASQRTLADKLIPAVNLNTGFTGLALFKHAPITGTVAPASYAEGSMGWTLGVTENGFLKLYDSANSTYQDMKWDNVRNAMGVVGLLVNDKEKALKFLAPNYDQTVARVGIGMNYGTKERFIVIVNGDDKHGCTSEMLADVFMKYHCNVAVETANAGSAFAMDKGELAFMPASADVVLAEDGLPNPPHTGAFWYITKRRHYKNEYVRDVAGLMQRLGQHIWSAKISSKAVDSIEGTVKDLADKLSTETAERKEKDAELQGEIDAEKKLRERVDNDLYAELHKEEADRAEGDKTLDQKIDKKVNDLKQYIVAEDNKVKKLLEEKAEELHNADIEKVETTIEGNKRKYTLKRYDGTNVEVDIETFDYAKLLSTLGDITNFSEQFSQFRIEYNTWKDSIDESVRDMKETLEDHETRIGQNSLDITGLKTTASQLREQMSALDKTVASFQSQIVQMELAFEGIKDAWEKYYTEWLKDKEEYKTWKASVDETLADYEERLTKLDTDFKERIQAEDAAFADVHTKLTTLREESQTYWQKFDQFEAKQTESNKNVLRRLTDAEQDRADIWAQVDKNTEGLAAEHEQSLKDATRLAQFGLRMDSVEAKNVEQDETLSDLASLQQSAKEQLDYVKSRVAALEPKVEEHTGQLSSMDNRLSQVEDRQNTADTHIEALQSADKTHEERLDNLEKADTSFTERLDELEGQIESDKTQDAQKDTAQDERLEALEGSQTDLSGRLDSLEEELHAVDTSQYVLKAGDAMTGALRVPNLELGDGSVEWLQDTDRIKAEKGEDTTAVRVAGADAVADDEFTTKKQVGDLITAAVTSAVTSAVESYFNETIKPYIESFNTDTIQPYIETYFNEHYMFEMSEDNLAVRPKNHLALEVLGEE